MEQSCYKCGQSVEEGTPFCPHCSAPQIRVVISEPPQAPAALSNLSISAQGEAALPASQTVPVLAAPMQWSGTAQPCAFAALIAAVAMVLKLMMPLIAAVGAGFLAVAFYRSRNPGAAVSPRAGARLGALSGVLCSAITAILLPLRIALLHEGGEIRDTLLESLRRTAARYPDPQFQATLDFWRSPTGLGLMLACLAVFCVVSLVALGALGGALGGAVLGRRNRN
jgi:RNA polymerase subunit RPABC4/transcription elongation factor Spt4